MTRTQERSFAQMNDIVIKKIRVGMAKEGIKNYTELAKLIHMPRATLYGHIKSPIECPATTLLLISLAIRTPLYEILGGLQEEGRQFRA